MDDSRVVSPEGSLDGATLGGLLGYYTAALGSHSRHNSYLGYIDSMPTAWEVWPLILLAFQV